MRLLHIAALFLVIHPGILSAGEPTARWYKGNLHTHSLWSDGDEFPEMIASWYRDQGYHFLALSDHNVLSEGVRWMSKKAIVKRSDDGIVDRYIDRFGSAWVEQRSNPRSGDPEVRLKPLDEFRSQVESAGEFIMIPGEEISDRAEGKPVHINATNLAELIEPARGETVRQAIANNLRIILQHEKDHGREVLPHLNHPNFGYAVTAEDLAAVTDERFFEVYNGHPGVNHLGDKDRPGVEAIWDQVNTIRLQAGVPALFGIGTDDSHEYHGVKGSHPGRGWVMVKSLYLSPEHLIRAMKRGDFYASSGVELESITFDSRTRELSVRVAPREGVAFRTEYIASTSREVGIVVATSFELSSRYEMKPGELYVRARITSEQSHPDPSFENQKQQAWTQPVGWQLSDR
ncbi:MAG: hypothetical protein AAFX06_11820 [Planctomycetota bacterium]